MSSKSPRQSQSPPSTPHGSKFSKFLSKQAGRDRSRSMIDTNAHSALPSAGSSSSSISEGAKIRPGRSFMRSGSRKASESRDSGGEKRRLSKETPPADTESPDDDEKLPSNGSNDEHSPRIIDTQDEPPVIVAPVTIPRPRTRSERPLSDNYPTVAFYPSSSSSNRLADFPSRLSGWFSHTFSSSSTDLSLPSLISQQHLASAAAGGTSSSPKGKGSALLTAAKYGTSKVMRYVLDSDATPDRCAEPIWLLGVQHPGWDPSAAPPPPSTVGRRSSVGSRRSPPSLSSSAASSPTAATITADAALSQSQPMPGSNNAALAKDPGRHWPPVFYADFTSRIWLTYRSQFIPIRDVTLEDLDAPPPPSAVSTSPQPKRSFWPLGGEKCWSSDAGWGCMVRTGQSLLANTILFVHLGRDWRKPPHPVLTEDYATYVRILTWFLDDPSSPFSVHRMTIVGKSLGTRIGQWFGPAIAAQAIRTLVRAFPEAGLGVFYAGDLGTVYESEVIAASHSGIGSPRKHARQFWGDRAVLILIGQKLGPNSVNEVYYTAVKEFLRWPQSVGIAGGRPSSSYYFVGTQADSLFYLDPHHARPAIPLRPPPPNPSPVHGFYSPSPSPSASRHTSPEPNSSSDRERSPRMPAHHIRSPTSPASIRSHGSSFSHRNIVSPSPLQQQISTSSSSTNASYTTTTSHAPSSATTGSGSHAHLRWRSSSIVPDDSEMDSRELGIGEDLDPVQRHYVTAYSATELNTFHCDRVRKMPLSGMDPSMLIGFLCKDEADWIDLKRRITELNESNRKAIVITLQDEPPNWASDSDMGLESISEPDIDLPDEDDEDNDDDDDDDDEEFSDAQDHERSASESPVDSRPSSKAEEGDTEDDPVDPITPGAGKSAFVNIDIVPPGAVPMQKSLSTSTSSSGGVDSLSFDDEDEVEWIGHHDADVEAAGDGEEDVDVMTPQQEYSAPPPMPPLVEPSLAESQATIHPRATHAHHAPTGGMGLGLAPPPEHAKHKRKTNKKKPSKMPAMQQQFPFPATASAEDENDQEEAAPAANQPRRIPQMRTAKARDGGRTQSGGVRGVPAEDLDDL